MLKRLLRDTGLSAAVEMSHRAANVILFTLVSLFLGAHEAGAYTVAFSYTLIATRMTFWGLDQLLIREASKEPDALSKIFRNFIFLRVLLSLLAWVGLYGVTTFLLPESDGSTRFFIFILGLSILPESVINLCQAVLMAHQKMHISVLGRVVETLVKVVGGWIVLWLWGGLAPLVWMIVVGSFVGMLWLLVPVALREVDLSWRIDLRFCMAQLQISIPFMISGMFYIFDSRFDILILSFFLDEAAIGIYNAALTVTSTLMIVPQAYQMAVFPLMARLYAAGSSLLDDVYRYSLKYLIFISMFLTVFLTVAPAPLVSLLGSEFERAAPTLRILSWTLLPLFFNVPVVRLLVTDDKQAVTARTMLLRIILDGTLGLLLIWQFKGLGAASSRLISSVITVAINYVYASRWVLKVEGVWAMWLKALVAGTGVGVLLVVFKSYFPYILPLAGGAYLLLLLVMRSFSPQELTLPKVLYRTLRSRLENFLITNGYWAK